MPNYSFSVGKVKIKQGSVVIKNITPLRDIDVRYEVTTSREYDADGVPLNEFTEEERTIITFSFASGEFDTALMQDEEYDIVFETGGDGGNKGISLTLASVKLTGYDLHAAQSEFSIVTLTFSKRGEIDSAPGEEPTLQKVKFSKEGGGEIYLGDHAYVATSYKGNARSLIIPTALGVLCRSTNDLGGGELEIKVMCSVEKDTRLELEQYILGLYDQLSTESGTLTVEYGATNYTIDNCVWVDGSPATSNKKHASFELTFIKSAY